MLRTGSDCTGVHVAVSRGRYDAQIFTNDADKLGNELSRDVSKHSAIASDENLRQARGAAQDLGKESSSGAEPTQAQDHAVSESHGHSMER